MLKICCKCKVEKEEELFPFVKKHNNKKYYVSPCKACISLKRKTRYLEHREKETEVAARWRIQFPEKYIAWREGFKKRSRLARQELRKQVLLKLGNECIKCGNKDYRVLQVDHVDGNGNKERKEQGMGNGSTTKYLKRILDNTTNSYQLLCANCNLIKYYEKERNT
jgi:hypothetical protein